MCLRVPPMLSWLQTRKEVSRVGEMSEYWEGADVVRCSDDTGEMLSTLRQARNRRQIPPGTDGEVWCPPIED
uniref:Uncharacterized protein n=1 Tax=Picea glauca TaxID=3330 RepID=A0A101M0X4_PICGL|nr:hypothetical protein ABT39_MTgene4223 [Picea glauca]QHR87889.1 hypothetical protein Q903MT_gene1901 [Picea sitchensis]